MAGDHDPQHDREHGEITARLGTMQRAVDKLGNGKTVDLVVKGAVAVLGVLELQARTGIEIGTAREVPSAAVKLVLALIGGI